MIGIVVAIGGCDILRPLSLGPSPILLYMIVYTNNAHRLWYKIVTYYLDFAVL